jgi:amidase
LLPFGSATEIAAAIRSGDISAREALQHYVSRVERFNPTLNAIVAQRIEEAQLEADRADSARLARGATLGPLHGVPMTVKESFRVNGMPITWGHKRFAETFSNEDAPTIRRLRRAGAIIFGKTNVPCLLADWQTYNDVYGVTNNPWDVTRSPGGSSGGAAVALAAGLTALELGTDIGASIRNPAHYCGIYGHKPTFELVTQAGHAPPGVFATPDLGVVGPLARSATDLDLQLGIIAGADDIDGLAWRLELPAPRHDCMKSFRIAVLPEAPVCPVDEETHRRISALIDFLRHSGARVDVGAWPADVDFNEMHRLYIHLLRAATSRNFTSEEVTRFRTEVGLKPTRSDEYWTATREGVAMGHREWLMLNEIRHRLRRQWAVFFESYDVLITPIAATAAIPHDHSEPRHSRRIEVDGRQAYSIDQLFYAGIATAPYLPATAIPVGLSSAGLPIGAQLIGPQYADRTTIGLAKLIEKEFAAFVAPPGFAGTAQG